MAKNGESSNWFTSIFSSAPAVVTAVAVAVVSFGIRAGYTDAPSVCLGLPFENGQTNAVEVVWAGTDSGTVALVRVDNLVYAIPAAELPSSTRPRNPLPADQIHFNALPNNALATWGGIAAAEAIPKKALPGAFVAELELPAGQLVTLDGEPGLGTWAEVGGQMALILNDDEVFWAIPSNATLAAALPSNHTPPRSAIPAEAIPSNAIPSNAIPSNLWVNALPGRYLAEVGFPAGQRASIAPASGGWSKTGAGVWAELGDQMTLIIGTEGGLLWAIPSNATLAAAIPSNHTPPRSAIPAEAIPSNAIPSNAIPSNLVGSLFNAALPASALAEALLPAGGIVQVGDEKVVFSWVATSNGVAMALPASALPASALPASALPASALPSSVLVPNSAFDNDLPIPSRALPASALPASALPASALPASALPASALPASLVRTDGFFTPAAELVFTAAALPASARVAPALPASLVDMENASVVDTEKVRHLVKIQLNATAQPSIGPGGVVPPLLPAEQYAQARRDAEIRDNPALQDLLRLGRQHDTLRSGLPLPGTPTKATSARKCTPVESFATAMSGGFTVSADGTVIQSWWSPLVRVPNPSPPTRSVPGLRGDIQIPTEAADPGEETPGDTSGPGQEIGEDTDLDDDGYPAVRFGGGDCSDYNPDIHPGAFDIPGDGIDQDCTGKDAVDPGQEVGEDTDKDDDGYKATKFGGTDCNDNDPTIHPGVTDKPGDGIDQDCNGKDATPPSPPSSGTSPPPPPPSTSESLTVSAVEVYGPSAIEESFIAGGSQYCDSPFETWIDAWMDRKVDGQSVSTGPSDLTSVWMSWKVGGLLGSTEMQYLQTDLWSAQFGPFDADTISGGDSVVTITVTMTRLDGTTDTGTTKVTLRDCDPPLEG